MYGYVYLNGRFLSVDPLAEKFAGWSAYHYSANNPINITDPSGMDWSETNIDLARRFGAFGDNCPTCPKDGNYQSEIDSYFDYTYDKTTGKATKNEVTKKDLPEVTIVGSRSSDGTKGGSQVAMGPGSSILSGTASVLSYDLSVLEPSDAFHLKWIGYGAVFIVGGLTYLTVDQLKVQSKKNGEDNMKGGKRSSRDKDYGINNKDFWRWWHRQGKPSSGGRDIGSKSDADKIFNDWVSKGKPTTKNN